MKKVNKKHAIVASALALGTIAGGGLLSTVQNVSATDGETEIAAPEFTEGEMPEFTEGERPELPEGEAPEFTEGEMPEGKRPGKPADLTDEEWEAKKAEMEEKLANMTEEEKQEFLESHRGGGPRGGRGERPGKPADLTDEEWEAKKEEMKAKMEEKFANMTEEEKEAWKEAHKKEKPGAEAETEVSE